MPGIGDVQLASNWRNTEDLITEAHMLSALAAVILCFLMLIPLANIAVGLIAGAVLGGIHGAVLGAVIGMVITGVGAGLTDGYSARR